MSDYRFIGKCPFRKDALDKVTGAARYSGDFYADGMVYGKIVTSPYAHARILSIDDSEAKKLPGYVGIVKTVLIFGLVVICGMLAITDAGGLGVFLTTLFCPMKHISTYLPEA